MKKTNPGFTLTEIMVVVVIASIILAGIYKFTSQQRQGARAMRMKADLESLEQIAFFIIGRDIRRAGSNPKGALGYSVGVPLPLAQAKQNRIEIRADLDGDGSVMAGSDEDITYEFIDDPAAPDGIPDQIRRQSGNQLVIQNVKSFDLNYQLVSGSWTTSPIDPAFIRKVRIHMVAGTGHQNQLKGTEDTKEVQMDIVLRNFH